MAHPKNSFANIPTYRNFVNQRDLLLEELLKKSYMRISDDMRNVLSSILGSALMHYDQMIHIPGSEAVMNHIVDNAFLPLYQTIQTEIMDLRNKTYSFTVASEHEAIHKVLGKGVPISKDHEGHLNNLKRELPSGGDIVGRLTYSIRRLKNKIIDAIHLGILNQDSRLEFAQRVYNSFPKQKKIQSKRFLKQIKYREAATKPVFARAMDDKTWQSILDDYTEKFVPKWRSPENQFPVEPGYPISTTAEGEEVIYAWDVEREMASDFVTAVRNGMVDAANKQGITDFSIIAILDDKTCEKCCGDFGCVDFDGKLVSEVEKMTHGAHSTAPFHFSCRCSMAPVTDDMPEYVKPDTGDFDKWLQS